MCEERECVLKKDTVPENGAGKTSSECEVLLTCLKGKCMKNFPVQDHKGLLSYLNALIAGTENEAPPPSSSSSSSSDKNVSSRVFFCSRNEV